MTTLAHPTLTAVMPAPVSSVSGLHQALATTGRHESARTRIIDALRELEADLRTPGRCVRDEITGPIVDAMLADSGTLSRTLANGLTFQFRYRSRIAREFVMAPQSRPDHVWEPQTTRLLLHLARDARQVIVGGAYMGDHAVLIAHQLRSTGGTCHAFEPNAAQFEMLELNAALNGLMNLHAQRSALWDEANETLMLTGDDAEAHCRPLNGGRVADDGAKSFRTTTIEAFAKAAAIDRIDLIMLDIEGAELHALRGAERFLCMAPADAPSLVFEIHSRYSDWSRGLANTEAVRWLRSIGYHVYAVRDHHGNLPMGDRPIEIIPPERTVIAGPPHGFNMLAVKRAEVIDGPPFRLCYDVSPKLLSHKDPALHGPIGGW